MKRWLFKSEPNTWSWDDQVAKGDAGEPWDGIRNYQARNFMRDEMQVGDQVLLYHSSCETPGVVGVMEVASEAYPDPTALDPDDKYYDPKSDPEDPRWFLVDVRLQRALARTITLQELREQPGLQDMQLLRRGNRLSVMPVSADEFAQVLELE